MSPRLHPHSSPFLFFTDFFFSSRLLRPLFPCGFVEFRQSRVHLFSLSPLFPIDTSFTSPPLPHPSSTTALSRHLTPSRDPTLRRLTLRSPLRLDLTSLTRSLSSFPYYPFSNHHRRPPLPPCPRPLTRHTTLLNTPILLHPTSPFSIRTSLLTSLLFAYIPQPLPSSPPDLHLLAPSLRPLLIRPDIPPTRSLVQILAQGPHLPNLPTTSLTF